MRQALAALPAVLLLATPLSAQEPAFENVYVDVEGAAVQIPVALAAEACSRDEGTLRADVQRLLEETGMDPSVLAQASGAEAGDAQAATDVEATAAESNGTVTTGQGTADPSTSEPGSELLALAVCQVDIQTAANLGIPQANEIVTD